jgi:hypothetical protein
MYGVRRVVGNFADHGLYNSRREVGAIWSNTAYARTGFWNLLCG